MLCRGRKSVEDGKIHNFLSCVLVKIMPDIFTKLKKKKKSVREGRCQKDKRYEIENDDLFGEGRDGTMNCGHV